MTNTVKTKEHLQSNDYHVGLVAVWCRTFGSIY
jgi:hypothetical protein